jgi:hypothetical protein
MHFFHYSDTCYLGSNGSTKFLESTIVFDSFLEGRSTMVLEYYDEMVVQVLILFQVSEMVGYRNKLEMLYYMIFLVGFHEAAN